MSTEQPIKTVKPSWWNFFWHIVFFWLLFIPVIVALVKRASLTLYIYESKVILEKGLLSKNSTEICISDIRTINVNQSLLQRLFGIGDISIATAATSGYEDFAYGLPDPKGLTDLLMKQKQALGVKA